MLHFVVFVQSFMVIVDLFMWWFVWSLVVEVKADENGMLLVCIERGMNEGGYERYTVVFKV